MLKAKNDHTDAVPAGPGQVGGSRPLLRGRGGVDHRLFGDTVSVALEVALLAALVAAAGQLALAQRAGTLLRVVHSLVTQGVQVRHGFKSGDDSITTAATATAAGALYLASFVRAEQHVDARLLAHHPLRLQQRVIEDHQVLPGARLVERDASGGVGAALLEHHAARLAELHDAVRRGPHAVAHPLLPTERGEHVVPNGRLHQLSIR